MFSLGLSGGKKADQLPPLSPSPLRSRKDRDTHRTNEEAGRFFLSLPVTTTRSTDGPSSNNNNNSSSSNNASSTEASVTALRQQTTTRTPPPPRDDTRKGAQAPPLSNTTLHLALTSTYTSESCSSSSNNLASRSVPVSGANSLETPYVRRWHTCAGSTAGESQHTPLQQRQCSSCSINSINTTNNSSSSPVNMGALGGVMDPRPPPQLTRSIVFSSRESEPRVTPPQLSFSSESKDNSRNGGAADTAATPAHPSTNVPDSAPRPSATLPLTGVYLQPSTFRIGATGRDVLWALYKTNGVIANYLDPSYSAGQDSTLLSAPPPPSLATLTNASPASAAAASLTPLSSLAATGESYGASANALHKAANSSSSNNKSINHNPPHGGSGSSPVVSLATTTLSMLAEEKQRSNHNSCSSGGGGSNGSNVPSCSKVKAEVMRCLNGAGGSTPCLLSFDYVVKPARYKQLSEEEARLLRENPLATQLCATGVNAMEEVVPGTARHVVRAPMPTTTTTAAAAAATTTAGGEAAETSEGGVMECNTAAAEAVSAATQPQQQQQQKELWLNEMSDTTAHHEATAGGISAAPPLQPLQRRRACGEVVQSCLHAARRAGSTHGQLFYCEPLPPNAAGFFAAHGSISHLLAGSTVAEGGRLMPSPLWNGVQVALATMAVGEEATFVMGPEDTTRFSAPLDGTAYIRAGTSAFSSAAVAASVANASGGAGPSLGHGSMGEPPLRSPMVNFVVSVQEPRAITFNTPHSRHRPSPHRTSHPPSLRAGDGGGGDGVRRRSRSNSTSSHRRSSSAASSPSAQSSPASSRASSIDAAAERGRGSGGAPRGQQPPPPPPPSPQQRKSSRLFRVRDWGKKGRSSSGDRNGEKERKPLAGSGASTPSSQHQQTFPAPLPPHPSPTHTYPPRRRRGSHTAPLSIPTTSTKAVVPVTAGLGVLQPTPRPPQRVYSPAHGTPVTPPSSWGDGAAVSDDVRAYEAASYGAVEPVVVGLRLRERIPLLPIRFTSAQPTLLISAEPVAEDGEQQTGAMACVREATTGREGGVGAAEESSSGKPAAPTRLPAAAPAEKSDQRTTSNMSAGALSACTTTAATTSVTSESVKRRGIVTDALLCLRASNLMRAELATSFHYLTHRRGKAEGTALNGKERTSSMPDGPRASPPTMHNRSLASTMRSVLDRVEVRDAGRAALFAAIMYVIDGKLLSTRDHARVLEGACCRGADANGAKARNNELPVAVAAAAAAAAVASPTAITLTGATTAEGSARGSAAEATSAPATLPVPTRYLWMPHFRVSDAVGAFARHWHSGAFNSRCTNSNSNSTSRRGTSSSQGASDHPKQTSSVSYRTLWRTLDEFTHYPHYTATVSYTVSVFNSVTRAYEPYVSPVHAAGGAAADASDGDGVGGATTPLIRSCLGCVLQPCWLDAVLRANRCPCGTDIHVVTRGHAAEAEERLFVCSVLADITAASQEAAAAFVPPHSSTSVEGADVGGEMNTPVGATATAGKGRWTTPAAAPGAPTQPTNTTTTTTATACLTSANYHHNHADTVTPTALKTHGKSTHNGTDEAAAVALRSLAASTQLLKRRGGEQRYRVRVYAYEPALTSQSFFACSPKDGLAAAQSLLVDAAVLLGYYFRVLDGVADPALLRTGGGFIDGSSPTMRMPHLSCAVPPVLRSNARLVNRSEDSRQRLLYLLFGDQGTDVLAAAMESAQAMGYTSPSSTLIVGAHAHNTSANRTDTVVSPPIEVVAAAMMFVSPSAANATPTLASRVPLALERVLLKALPMLYLAICLLTFGADEVDASPAVLLERSYGPWWELISSPQQQQQEDHRPSAQAATTRSAATPATATTPPAPTDEQAQLLFGRYTALGECFHHLALLYAELPGFHSQSWEACSMALFYLPRAASLWALWGELSRRLGHTKESSTALGVAVQLLTTPADETADRKAGQALPSGRLTEASISPEEPVDWRSRAALLRHLRERV
ncbi:hypothetical protein ABB37_01937 [Leptomonas pyrrhocoris]|uniref:Uncharacterized protein n=1 Tax=Leptomonas pyrrhocoris TaxID=157538 RepID=A0A0M9G731_LEPPY|nr:hypothetical protein ABB37_01937 [Leptomonas pyrrhocoris]KPA83679.1 hypothetical protein ABB37_01937 [Leptomonas pyrrhocoris]|eukprot:XP_015662118.1 hypothetical protein ABB37_01937 [Leptomonas pyrrhocoris]